MISPASLPLVSTVSPPSADSPAENWGVCAKQVRAGFEATFREGSRDFGAAETQLGSSGGGRPGLLEGFRVPGPPFAAGAAAGLVRLRAGWAAGALRLLASAAPGEGTHLMGRKQERLGLKGGRPSGRGMGATCFSKGPLLLAS